MSDLDTNFELGGTLPEGWCSTEIDNILKPQSDGKLIHQGWSPQCDKEPAKINEWGVLKTTAIQDGFFLDYENKKLPLSKEPKPRIEVHSGDLLVTNAGPRSRCGVICFVKQCRDKLLLSGKMYRLRFPEDYITPSYIESWLRTSIAQKELNDRKTGISESGLNMTQARFKTLPVIVAPIAEQKIIADKLEELLEQVKSTKAHLDAIPAILKSFRQSVLAAAVSGELTEEWRSEASDEWSEVKLIDVVEKKPRNGRSPQGVNYVTQYRNLTLSATTPGKFVDNKFKYVELNIDDSSHLWVKNGDILIQRGNTIDYVGVSALYLGEDNQYVYPDLMMKCKPSKKVIGKYLHLALLSEGVRKYFRDNATGTAGNMPKINQKTVSEAPFSLPPLEEQTEIVRRVEGLFAFADKVEAQVNKAQLRVNNLTQSILAKAFRGELTADWRAANPELISGDNSAESLLERIKTEREALAKATKASKEKPVKKVSAKKVTAKKTQDTAIDNNLSPVESVIADGVAHKPQDIFDKLTPDLSMAEIFNEISKLLSDNKIEEKTVDGITGFFVK
ncbi:restriction endonuclease subunit S [Shewanella sp.]|uniref:restriction endonuclease subunit S n=1 Tax=Shewanella sp. TaxID=50422 RepID=UPI001EC05A79|nr:restriction endonuclease subunit S [Shewanella sp.]NRB23646.1 restriction endonuclease subunit S [Shewanella sp.]